VLLWVSKTRPVTWLLLALPPLTVMSVPVLLLTSPPPDSTKLVMLEPQLVLHSVYNVAVGLFADSAR